MSAPLWSYDALLKVTKGRRAGAAPDDVTGISIDSRTLRPGDAFFAIKGDTHDGHDFVTLALGKGASTAVVADARLPGLGRAKGCLTIVDDVLDALRRLGIAARARSQAGIVAVTGSVGKTGTKEMLAATLGADGETHYSPASFNNHWGVPLTLARMPLSAKYGVFEIGMNHAGEIEPLVKMVRPRVAVITTVEPVHLEYFKSVKDIARAKAEIFLGLEEGGTAILNRDNAHYTLLAKLAKEAGVERVVSFGEHKKADIRLEDVCLKPECSCVSASVFGEAVSYKLGAPGRHVVQNSLAVLGAVSLLGADLAKACLALADIHAPRGRGERHVLALPRGGEAILIDESYNANPASMRAAIALLGQAEVKKSGRRIAVLGDMRELGKDSAKMHAGLAEAIDAAHVHAVFLAGPMMHALWDALPAGVRGGYAETAAALEPAVMKALAPGDIVMVKGSNASRMGPLVDNIKARLLSRKSAAEDRQEQETA
ncbi:MAG TPA: UDP-N-acetylmuramoylalanyl-D-glutamyl-2,6-diaminopimelate--D-alanyl-D-alanine ligase [Bauldia sp.]|nr:UDP-N-acetylmuramoylalanyl-D-glutamyl-2,6-diaminopimelate--D-alanyl-D-alanine ligase [Bauldia sp.]